MISIIVSSYKDKMYRSLVNNISNTCGIDYELIRIKNNGEMSINQAYNIGINKSSYEYLLFIHEDIQFSTANWGRKLKNLFENDDNLGLVGVAGSMRKTKAPSAWGEGGDSFNKIFIKQFDGGSLVKDYTIKNYSGERYSTVAVLDGVFLATKKSFGLRFDERLGGFHNYDVALSIRNFQMGLNAIVTHEIIISHYSKGNFDKSWLASTHQFHKLYNNCLPVYTHNNIPDLQTEKRNYIVFFNKCLINQEYGIAWYYLVKIWKRWFYTWRPYYMALKLLGKIIQSNLHKD